MNRSKMYTNGFRLHEDNEYCEIEGYMYKRKVYLHGFRLYATIGQDKVLNNYNI